MKDALNVDVLREDEMDCLITGEYPFDRIDGPNSSSFFLIWFC
jgi:hypothetical protein